jgi:hypothetical protein
MSQGLHFMNENYLKGQNLSPLLCTYAELHATLHPYTDGYKWGEGTIHDLWKRLSPTPNSIVGTPSERRIIAPGHLGEWLLDVLKWQGFPATEMITIYGDFMEALSGRRPRADARRQ